eukprot:3750342-Pleurochrysis_carterae.AAC.1
MGYAVDTPRHCELRKISARGTWDAEMHPGTHFVLFDRELDIAWCADGGPAPSSSITGWSGLCPRPDRRCSV